MATIRHQAADDRPHPVDGHLRAVLDTMPALVWLADADGAAVHLNQRWLQYTGLSAEQARGRGWTIPVHDDDIDRVTTHWQTLLGASAPGDIDVRLRGSDGQYRWFLFSAAPLRDDSGRLTGWCGTNIDIDDRRRAEQALAEQPKRTEDAPNSREGQFRALLDRIPAMIAIHSASGELELESRAAQEYHGRSGDEQQLSPESTVHPDDLPALVAAQQRALSTGEPLEFEMRLRRADGAYRWFHMRSRRSSDDDAGTLRWYTVGTDIHDRRTAEETARAAERDLRLVLDTVPALVKTMTPTGEIDFANRRLLEYLGVGLDQLQDWPRFIHDSDRPMMLDRLQHSLDSGEPYEAQCRLRRADGVYRWVHGSAVPVRAEDGTLVRWYYLITDIEDRKQAEDLLRSSERQFRAIVDNIPALVGVITGAGELEIVNKASLDYHGLTLDELRRWKVNDLVHPEDLPAELAALTRSFETGQPLEHEHRLRRADGEYRWFQLRALRSCDEWNGSPRWYCVEIDIHDRKLAEQALRESETRLIEVQQLSRTGAWRFAPATGVVESSPEIQRVYGVQPGEDISQPQFWFDRIHPEDRPRVQAHFERCLNEKSEYQAGYRIVLPDGSIRYQYATGHPVTNDTGDVVEFIGASMDMTEHWLATNELERASEAVRNLEARMSRAAQIATVGELAGSIAHEVNQPLAAVVANGHACLRWLSASPANLAKAREAAERIVKDGKDAGEVVRRVRALFKRTAVDKVQLDLGEVIAEVLHLVDSHPVRQHVALEVALDPNLPSVVADRVQVQQLVLNLTLNALEALESVSGRRKQLSIRSKRAEARQVAIQISDNGIGMDDPVAAFEPFVTTKPEGMGLGLAICRSIVAAHDGRLWAERNAGFGMIFTVTLPIHPDAPV